MTKERVMMPSLGMRGVIRRGVTKQVSAKKEHAPTKNDLVERTPKLRLILNSGFGLAMCGIAVTLLGVASAPEPAAAFGGFSFGHMGGYGGGGFGGGGFGGGLGMGSHLHPPIGAARRPYAARPSNPPRNYPGNGDGKNWPPRHPVIGHPIIVPGGGGPPPAVAKIPAPVVAKIPPPPPPPNNTVTSNVARGGGTSGGMPPRGERRFVPDEVITTFTANATPQAIEELARRHNVTQLETINLPLLGTTVYRWRINGQRPVGDLVGSIEDERIVASVQPNYLFTLQEDAAKMPATGASYADQYVLGKLEVEQAHRVATGKTVTVALIDSEIDNKNPNLDGAIVKNYDALGGDDTPHQHGTAMAGAIAAHGKLIGIAPAAQLLAARAFDVDHDAKSSDAKSSQSKARSSAIYKSLQWATDNGARVVNMSFAGPADPTLHRLLAAAADKGLVLVAAAGNDGPNAAPLYPGADPNVIAVTATDSSDALFAMANRGSYVAVAAPGVDILALAPGEALQLSTGTSVATAHVSGLAALLLECNPALKPADIRAMLAGSAKPLGSGAKLVNAYRAVTSLNAGAPSKAGGAQAKE
jgi:subtilisin family serine protease